MISNLPGPGGIFPISQVSLYSLYSHTLLQKRVQTKYNFTMDCTMSSQKAIGKLSVILKQGLFPGGAKAALITAIRSHGHGTAIGGRAPGSVRHIHAVTKKLSDQLDIRCLRASSAGSRELEVRLGKLGCLNTFVTDHVLFQKDFIYGIGVKVGLLISLSLKGDHLQSSLGRAHR